MSQSFHDIGLRLQLPADAKVTRIVQDEFPVWQVESGPGAAAWSMRIQVAVAPEEATDLAGQASAAIDGLRSTGTTVKVLRESDRDVGGVSGRVIWATATRGEASVVAGWLLVRTGPGVFVSLGTLTTPAAFPETEPTLEAIFASAHVTDPRQMQAERNEAVRRGDDLRGLLTPARLRSLVRPGSRVSRIWKPGPGGGETELGWVEMAVTSATRSEAAFNRGGPEDPGNREQGLLVMITARMNDADGIGKVETQARYWVSWDLQAEAWVVRSLQRGTGPDVRYEQIGLRPRGEGGRPGNALIVSSQSGGESIPPLELEVPSVAYLPQAVAIMLGSLLPQDPARAGDAIFYALDPATARMCQRPVQWQPSSDGSWTLTTRNTPETRPVMERIGSGGGIDRTEPDGTRTTPSSLEEIRRRWKAMGLEP